MGVFMVLTIMVIVNLVKHDGAHANGADRTQPAQTRKNPPVMRQQQWQTRRQRTLLGKHPGQRIGIQRPIKPQFQLVHTGGVQAGEHDLQTAGQSAFAAGVAKRRLRPRYAPASSLAIALAACLSQSRFAPQKSRNAFSLAPQALRYCATATVSTALAAASSSPSR